MLTGKDAKYFNSRIARHQVLCKLLGLEDEDEFDDEDDFGEESNSDFDQYLSNDLASEWLDDDEDEDK